MKFNKGHWMLREGVSLQGAAQAVEFEEQDGVLTAYASPRPVRNRSETLDNLLVTVEFRTPAPGVIGVKIMRNLGVQERGPVFKLNKSGGHGVIAETETEMTLTSGSLSVKIAKSYPWGVGFYRNGERVTGSGLKSMACITEGNKAYVREELDLAVGEYVYGLGERFTAFIKNGQTVDLWNEDGGTSSELAYKNIPFYVTNKGYGIFINHPDRVSLEVASEEVKKVLFSVEGESLEYFVIDGPTVKEALVKYTGLTGKPALPPAWTFGLWLTTSFLTDYDEATVMSFIDGMAERDLPLHVFHFDCFWMKRYHWTDFEWDKDVFPDPEGMLARIQEKGLKVCVWINPYIAQRSRLFAEGKKHGYLVKKPNGDVWQWDLWQAGMALVDFTNPAACEWYAGYLRGLVDIGVDCFKTDFGERIPTDVVYFDGSDPFKMHNYYTLLYNKTVFEALEEKLGKNEAALFARSATAGGQQFPVHWGGDCYANYESMAESLRGGLSLGLSGFGFWSHDIGGFESTAPAHVFKRWLAFGLLSSHSRLHGNESYRVPWLYDQEAVEVTRFFTKLKCSLMPYLYDTAAVAHEQGIPSMRAMLLEFPDDPTAELLDRQYMLGPNLLVAPVFDEQGRVTYYLPEGTWTHLLTGESVQGGRWLKETHDFFSLPLYVRPNSILATGAINIRPDYDFADGVNLGIYALEDGCTAEAAVRDLAGQVELKARASRSGKKIAFTVEGKGKAFAVSLHGVGGVSSVGGAVTERVGDVIRVPAGESKVTLIVELA